MSDLTTPFYYFVSCFGALYVADRWLRRRRQPLPPGPPNLPVIGGLLSFPKDHAWIGLAKHKEKYGPISYISVFSQKFILLNDRKAAFDLLEGRSAIYSDRPDLPFAELCGITYNFSLLRYDHEYKFQRKIVQQVFSSNNAVMRMRPEVEREMRRFLVQALTEPENVHEHLRNAAGAIILEVTYGYSVDTKNQDPLVHEVEEAMKVFMLGLQRATWIVDSLPFLRHVPSWMPGFRFKQIAREWRAVIDDFTERPYRFVKQQMLAGTAQASYVSTLLEQTGDNPDAREEFAFKRSASTMYGAGSDTTLSTIDSFFLAMLLYPDVQKKAQAEVDSVVGSDRLPTFSDREKLPYVEAVFKETLRWHTVVPFGLPHVVMEDDVYTGFYIPKGATILPNIWLLNHDPEYYENPLEFRPERFLGETPEPDPSSTMFGFGRRICAGKRLAQLSVFTAIAFSIATLSMKKALDENGNEISPVYQPNETTDELISHPKAFRCSVTARSDKARDLILSAESDYDFAQNDADAIKSISLSDCSYRTQSPYP